MVHGALLATRRLAGGEVNENPQIVYCHAQIYGEDEERYPTVDNPYRAPAGTGTVSHLKREMTNSGVRCVTAIPTSTFYRFDDRFTAASARDNKEIMIGVVALIPDDPCSPKRLEKNIQEYNVRGMRSIPVRKWSPGRRGRQQAVDNC